MNKTNRFLCALVACAALIMGFAYYANVMLLQDGGWYTYPAYAISMGGDPSENLPAYVIPHPHPGVTAKFIWENRTNLFVLHQWVGLEVLGDHWQGIRLVGALEWLSIAGVAGLITRKLTKSWPAAALVGAVVMSDSILIASALSNARPDVLNALLGLVALGGVEWIRRRPSDWVAFGVCLVIAVILPLIHVTSAIAISLVGFYLLLSIKDRYAASRSLDAGIWKLLLIGAVLCALYLFRNHILDHMIPTVVPQQFEDAGRHDLINKLKENFVHGGDKLAMEYKRWFAYFFIKNLSHLAFMVMGLFLLLVSKPSVTTVTAKRIALSVAGAVAFQLLTDPHPTSAHLIAIMSFAYVAAGLGIYAYGEQNPGKAKAVANGLTLLLLSTALLKLGQSYKVNKDYAGRGFTNAKVEAALKQLIGALPSERSVKLHGPTELWPYLTDLQQQITILDIDRTKLPASVDQVFSDQVSLLAINEDYWNSGWAPLISDWLARREIHPVLAFGTCSPKSACLMLYARGPQAPRTGR